MPAKTPYAIADSDRWLEDSDTPSYRLRVRDLPLDEKPREKLIAQGPEALSSTELLAILLGVGTRKEEVLSMSSRIFREYGEKALAFAKSPQTLAREADIPFAKACQIVSAFELGRRFYHNNHNNAPVIRTPSQVFAYLRSMASLPKEQLRGLYLNSHFKVIHDEVISVGTLTSSIIHPREVFRPAIEYSAAAVIIAHNHPSGSAKPTPEDISITDQLVECGKMLGIELLDHVVIGSDSYTSLLSDTPENA